MDRQKEIKMKEIIALCGLPSHQCGALLATQDGDEQRELKLPKNGHSYLR
jgi:hypothetical protein